MSVKKKQPSRARLRYQGDVFKPMAFATIGQACGDDPEFAEFSDDSLRAVLTEAPQWVATYRLVSVRKLKFGPKPIIRVTR